MTRCERQVQYVWFIYLDKWNHCQLILVKRFQCLLPREQMQFVSNLILSKLFFFFFPQWPIWMALKGELAVCCSNKRTTSVYLLSLTQHSKRAIWYSVVFIHLENFTMKIEITKYHLCSHWSMFKWFISSGTCQSNLADQQLCIRFSFCCAQQKIWPLLSELENICDKKI